MIYLREQLFPHDKVLSFLQIKSIICCEKRKFCFVVSFTSAHRRSNNDCLIITNISVRHQPSHAYDRSSNLLTSISPSDKWSISPVPVIFAIPFKIFSNKICH